MRFAIPKILLGPMCCLLVEQVAERMDGKVRVVKVDVDENPDLSAMLKVGAA